MSITAAEAGLAFFGLFLAGAIKGATGIGFSTAALPILVVAVGLKPAMALVALPAIASNVAVMASTGNLGVTAKRFWRFYVATIPGIAAGLYLLLVIDVEVATKALGLVTIAYVGFALAKPDFTLPRPLEPLLATPAGFANGVMTGLTGSQIMPLMPYMMSLKLDAQEQVQAVNLAVTIASSVLIVALMHAGVMSVATLGLSLAGVLPALAGVSAGSRIRSLLTPSVFRQVTLAVLSLIAVSLLMRPGGATVENACAPSASTAALRVPEHASR